MRMEHMGSPLYLYEIRVVMTRYDRIGHSGNLAVALGENRALMDCSGKQFARYILDSLLLLYNILGNPPRQPIF